MANRTLENPDYKRLQLGATVQVRIKNKLIELAKKENKTLSHYVEDLFLNHFKEKGTELEK
jgi:hypothetical protein